MTSLPKSQVSFAGFYDWTDDVGEVSVTNIYRKIADSPRTKVFNKGNKTWCTDSGNKAWCTDGVHLNPGRIFIRNKAELTKGEREIIAGIYKNRGDIQRDKQEFNHIRCHRDAWLVGKHVVKKETKPIFENNAIRIPESLFSSRIETTRDISPRNCYMCAKCKDECSYHPPGSDNQISPRTDRPGRMAPPSSPDGSPRTFRKFGKPPVPPIKIGQGSISIERGPTFIDIDDNISKKKVYVDVFLPKIGTNVSIDDFKTPVPPGSKSPVILNVIPECKLKYEHGELSSRHDKGSLSGDSGVEMDTKVLSLSKTARTETWSTSRDGSSGE